MSIMTSQRTTRTEHSLEPRFYSYIRSSDESKIDVPNEDVLVRFKNFNHRNSKDKEFIKEYNVSDISLYQAYVNRAAYLSTYPSYTKFKVPYEMICKERYLKSVNKYERQFASEIQKLIDNQSTARDSAYFVKIMSYTTLWPPYHNRTEIKDTSRRFYSLPLDDKKRLEYIMLNDFSYS